MDLLAEWALLTNTILLLREAFDVLKRGGPNEGIVARNTGAERSGEDSRAGSRGRFLPATEAALYIH
jgi:hypothetical protein